jgi:hypothetical protein
LAVAIVGGGGFGALKLSEHFNPPSKGADYLETHGYTHVQGGNVRFFSTCGENNLARSYTAINSQGQKVSETVCLNLFWSHRPWLG